MFSQNQESRHVHTRDKIDFLIGVKIVLKPSLSQYKLVSDCPICFIIHKSTCLWFLDRKQENSQMKNVSSGVGLSLFPKTYNISLETHYLEFYTFYLS